MNKLDRYLLKEARKAGRKRLKLGLVASIFLLAVLSFVAVEKSTVVWPAEVDLPSVTGTVSKASKSQKNYIKFELNNSNYVFTYNQIYGRKAKQIYDVITAPTAIVTVGYLPKEGTDRAAGVYKLSTAEIEVLSYAEAIDGFKRDNSYLPWLIGLSLFGLIVFSYQIQLLKKYNQQ